jgi:two-component system, cell cycle sensor histidine kinase and response regulator CckA
VIPLLVVVILIALAAAGVAATLARNARAAVRASEEKCRQFVEQAPAREAAARAQDQQVQQQTIEAVGRLAGDIAHDLNNLLTAIAGYTELLITKLNQADPMIQDAHEIRRAALGAARLTKQLLAVSRNQPATTEVIDVNAVVARTAGVLKRMLGDEIGVTLALDGDVKRIKVGASHVEEIVLNLALNARDAMPDGGRLTFTTVMHTQTERDAAMGPAGEYVRLIIADTGCGIPKEIQSTVFEPFLTTRGSVGSAIGLAKVYDIVKKSGGRIHLDSAAGVGTTFTVDLPATSEPSAALDPAPSSTRLDGGSVLIVEDEPRVRELVKVMLVRAGHDVAAAAGPHEAIALLKRPHDIKLVLIDIVLPEMNGYDLAAEVRKIAPDVQIVFMSGFACDLMRQSADSFLAKPFTVEALTNIVHEALAVSPSRRQPSGDLAALGSVSR